MIHQLIFANPKPGMSVKEFQDYWIIVHATEYAGKIKQIKKYKVNRLFDLDDKDNKEPLFNGMAEIWLENEEEQLKSLLSKEYVNGARADEPNWAAFWQTIGLDTYSYDKLLCDSEPEYKIVILMKRKEGIPLSVFREYLLRNIGEELKDIDMIKQLTISLVKDSMYKVGESCLDGALHIWINDIADTKNITELEIWKMFMTDLNKIINSKYLYKFLCQENRII
ncbi:MAG: EthD domain-containing protein [Lachnospiraceae bacterium]|nr:EthD domain-containing protein [Lachnospiraceae bacterium]